MPQVHQGSVKIVGDWQVSAFAKHGVLWSRVTPDIGECFICQRLIDMGLDQGAAERVGPGALLQSEYSDMAFF